MGEAISAGERRFATSARRKKRLFLALTAIGVAVAGGLIFYYGYRRMHDPAYPLGTRTALVLLILLNARQNLRQYRYAALLDKLWPDRGGNAPVC